MGSEGLSALLARVEAAEGPDRELDGDIARALGLWETWGSNQVLWHGHFTASLDASLALCERVLPGCRLVMGRGQTEQTRPWARIGSPEDGADTTAPTLALALLAAMLKALIALSAPSHPPAPWPFGHAHNAKHAGWNAYFGGKGRDASPFPPVRRDLHAGFAEGWDAAKAAAS